MATHTGHLLTGLGGSVLGVRTDRLVAVLVAAFFADLFDSTLLLGVVLALLAVASLVTVVQRIMTVRSQALAAGEVNR